MQDISLDELAMNIGNPSFGDDKLLIKFSYQPVKNEAKSTEEARPVFEDKEFITIRIPGDKTGDVFRPVRDADKQRFARAYQHWKSTGEGERLSGTPLTMWPAVTRSQVEELAFFNVKTVEQLASIADVHAQKFMGINALRQKAQRFLEAAASAAPLEKMQAELAERDNRIAAQEDAINDMKVQLAELRSSNRKK